MDENNNFYGPFYDDHGNEIEFEEWFHGGEPIKKKRIIGPLLMGLRKDSFRPALLAGLLMCLATVYSPKLSYRIYVSTADLVDLPIAFIRSLGSIFVHADFSHLGSNLLLFIPFAWLLTNYFGKHAFPIMGIVGGIVTNFLTVYFYHLSGKNSSLVGASGMVYLLASQWIALYLRWDLRHTVPQRVVRSIGVAMMLLLPTQYSPSTSYLAHGIGFVVGLIFAIPFMFKSKGQN